MKDLQQALAIDPNYVGALETLGQVYTDLEQYSLAVETLNKLVELRPNYGRGYYLLARGESGQGHSEKAKTGHAKSCSLGYRPACNE